MDERDERLGAGRPRRDRRDAGGDRYGRARRGPPPAPRRASRRVATPRGGARARRRRRPHLRDARRAEVARSVLPRSDGGGPEAGMSAPNGFLIVTRLTLHEAARRKILIAALIAAGAFLALFGVGFYFVVQGTTANATMSLLERRITLNILTLAGFFAVNTLTVMAS